MGPPKRSRRSTFRSGTGNTLNSTHPKRQMRNCRASARPSQRLAVSHQLSMTHVSTRALALSPNRRSLGVDNLTGGAARRAKYVSRRAAWSVCALRRCRIGQLLAWLDGRFDIPSTIITLPSMSLYDCASIQRASPCSATSSHPPPPPLPPLPKLCWWDRLDPCPGCV